MIHHEITTAQKSAIYLAAATACEGHDDLLAHFEAILFAPIADNASEHFIRCEALADHLSEGPLEVSYAEVQIAFGASPQLVLRSLNFHPHGDGRYWRNSDGACDRASVPQNLLRNYLEDIADVV